MKLRPRIGSTVRAAPGRRACLSSRCCGLSLVPLLAALAAVLMASVGVAVGMYARGEDAWLVVIATGAGSALLAAAAAGGHLAGRSRRQEDEEKEPVSEESGEAPGLRPQEVVPQARPGPSGASGPSPGDPEEGVELRRLREIAEGVHGVEALFDLDGKLVWVSPSVERLTGRSPAVCLAASDVLELVVHESDRGYCRRMAEQVARTGRPEDFEMRLAREDGRICWVACHWRRLRNGSGQPTGLRMSAEDIQERKETEYKLLETVSELRRAQALREHYLSRSNDERQRLSALLNVIRLGILVIDRDHRVLYYNRAMLDIWGFPPDENLIGVRDVVLQSRIAERLEQPERYFEHVQQVLTGFGVSEPYEIPFKDGRVVTDISAVVEGRRGQHGIGRVWIYEDITERRNTARRLVELAERDPLTNLFNRRRFHEELERFLAEAERRGVQVGLIAIDLDGFKPINDEYGHQAGDEVLVKLAQGVGSIIRRNEMFFRLGGDEFGVLVPDAEEGDLVELARRIVEGIEALSFEFEGKRVGLTASLGIALYPCHASDGEQLIAAADRAMYRSKYGGRNRWSVAGSVKSAQAPPDVSVDPSEGGSR